MRLGSFCARRGRGVSGGFSVLLSLVLVVGAVPAGAQQARVSVADFDVAGLEAVVLASFDAGDATSWYSSADSRWGESGSLLEGDVELEEGSSIARVMAPSGDGSLLRFNDDGPLVLRDFFGASGAGADLTVWVLTGSGSASFAASGVSSAGGNFVNFDVPASQRPVLQGIGAGQSFVLALTRPAETETESGTQTETEVETETETGTDPGIETETETDIGIETDTEVETETATGPVSAVSDEPAGTVLAGTLWWSAGVSGGLPYTGYAGSGRVGTFEARYWDGQSVGDGDDLYALAQIHGEVVTGAAAGLNDPVVLTMLPYADLSGGFWLEAGDLLLNSVDSVPPIRAASNTTKMQSWLWDGPCVRWHDADQAEMRIVAYGHSDDVFSAAYSDASLGGLSLEGALLDGAFDPSTPDYGATAAADGDVVTVDAAAASPNACGVLIEPADSDPGVVGHQVGLGDDGALVSVTVTAADGETTSTYSVAVGREAPPAAAKALSLGEAGDIDFEPFTRRYDTTLREAAQSVRVEPAPAGGSELHMFAITAGDTEVTPIGPDGVVSLVPGRETLVAVRATTPGNERQSIYAIRLRTPSQTPQGLPQFSHRPGSGLTRREQAPKGFSGQSPPFDSFLRAVASGPPRLDSLTLDGGTLVPTFAAATFEYSASVPHGTAQVTVTADAAADSTALIAAPDADPDTAGHQVALNASTSSVSAQTSILVVAANLEGNLESYVVTVTRAAESAGDATLSALAAGDLVLTPVFGSTTFGYGATAQPGTASVTVSYTTTQTGASAVVAPADSDTSAAGHQVSLADGTNTVTVTVTATDSTSLVYTITIERPASLSSDASLASLSVVGFDLVPEFGSNAYPDITMTLPQGCELLDLDPGGETVHRDWDENCRSLNITANTQAYYYRMYVRKPSPVWLQVGGSSWDSRIVLRKHDGTVVQTVTSERYWESCTAGPSNPFSCRLFRVLPRGVYVVEVAREIFYSADDYVPTSYHSLLYKGEGIVLPQEYMAGDEDVAEIVSAADIYHVVAEHDTESVVLDAVGQTGARLVISPPDADSDTDGHQVDLAEPGDSGEPTRAVAAVTATAQDGTRSTHLVLIDRPAAPPVTEVTMTLPAGCVLHDLERGGKTTWRRWDDDCDSLHQMTHPRRANKTKRGAQYYRLIADAESLVFLEAGGSSSSRLVLRSADGTVIAVDQHPNPQYYAAEMTRVLPRGVYVVEVAAEWHHFGRRGHSLSYKGSGVVEPLAYRLDSLDITDVALTYFRRDTLSYTRNVAADVTSATVTPEPSFTRSVFEITPADADTNTVGHQVTLDADGTTVITVEVGHEAISGATTTYEITLNRLAGTTSPLSADATLSSLALSGIDIGTFDPQKKEYPYTLSFYQALSGHSTTVTPVPTNSGATWTMSRGNAANQVWVDGNDTFKVYVAAQNGEVRRTYTLTPGRGNPATPGRGIPADPSKDLCNPCGSDAFENQDIQRVGDKFIVAGFKQLGHQRWGDDTFYVFDAATGAFEGTFTLDFQPPALPYHAGIAGALGQIRSFWTDGETLWATYGGHYFAYAFTYDTSAALRVVDPGTNLYSETKPRLPGKDIRLDGYTDGPIWSDGTTMYSLRGNSRQIASYDMATKQRLAVIDLESAVDVRFDGSIWSDGTTIWITDTKWTSDSESKGRILAFDLETGRRHPGLDVHASHSLGGFWSDGTTLWVVAKRSDTITAYAQFPNARLKSLSVDTGDIGRFNNGIFSYQATVPAATTTVTVAAEAAFPTGSSAVAFNTADADTTTVGHQVTLNTTGDTVVTITVTAPNGTDTEAYTITITKAT